MCSPEYVLLKELLVQKCIRTFNPKPYKIIGRKNIKIIISLVLLVAFCICLGF